MSRKVFISVLGTTFYEESVYGKDDFKSSRTRFIQRATLEWLGAKEWGEEDRVIIATTQEAKEKNWNASITMRRRKHDGPEEPYTGLETELKEMRLQARVSTVDIPNGSNEEEMWEIFRNLFNLFEEDDELYFDLTHSFRYLPMLVLVLSNYAKFLRNVKIRSITYGNYEAGKQNGISPIIDLLPLTALQDWTFAIADYLQNGNIERLNKEALLAIRPIQKQVYMSGEDKELLQEIKELRCVICSLTDVVQEWETCRGVNVINSKSMAKLKKHLELVNTNDSKLLPMLNPLLKKLENSLLPFNVETDISNMFAAAEWCITNQQYQAAITFLEEGVISFFCLRHGIRLDDETRRGLVNSAIFRLQEEEEDNTQNYSEEDYETINSLMEDEILCNQKFLNIYNEICKIRNDYNHCGMRSIKNRPMAPTTIMDNIGRYIKELKEFLLDN